MPAITPKAFLDALAEANIIRKGESIYRVTIVADMADPLVRILVERKGDARLLDVARAVKDA